MQFYLYADADAAEVLAWLAAYCTENGLPTELTEDAHATDFWCPRFVLGLYADPEEAQSRREFADFLLRDYGVTVRADAELDGQYSPAGCSEAQFADIIRYLLGKFDGDFFLFSEFYEWIVYRRDGTVFVHEEWAALFSDEPESCNRHPDGDSA